VVVPDTVAMTCAQVDWPQLLTSKLVVAEPWRTYNPMVDAVPRFAKMTFSTCAPLPKSNTLLQVLKLSYLTYLQKSERN
jgi:hypothetical protein